MRPVTVYNGGSNRSASNMAIFPPCLGQASAFLHIFAMANQIQNPTKG